MDNTVISDRKLREMLMISYHEQLQNKLLMNLI